MCIGIGRPDPKRAGELLHPKKVEAKAMHEATISLLLMAVVMFPCFLAMVTPE
jgi:hypothetical protein